MMKNYFKLFLLLMSNYFLLIQCEPKVCPGVHIRNDLKSFEQLRGCNIIDGPLTIALITDKAHPFEPKDYENLTFPHLYEINDYLLFFRVQGLSSLTGLFPNLAVIRGRELLSNYALIIYEMMHLQKIYLPKLSDILRGSVRIESNPNLCHVSTVNWEGICKHIFTPHFIKNNNPRCNNHCPEHCRPWSSKLSQDRSLRLQGDVKELGSENNRSIFCWTNQVCHELCQSSDGMNLPLGPAGGCCSSQCAGGCHAENRSDQCISCRSVLQGNRCVEQCDPNLYEYKGRCMSEEQCVMMSETAQLNACSKTVEAKANLKAIKLPGEKHGRCQEHCPAGFEEDPTNKNKCKRCDKGRCRKVCTPPQGSDKPFMVTNVNFLRELSGCNVINASLEISLKGGKNVLNELETALQELEEIKGYLKITRSYPILTLSFLNKLKYINGSELDRGQYSLIIIDNPNLQELFLFNTSNNSNQKQLKILNGKIFVHLNPKLCPKRIDDLKTYASVADWDLTDVSIHTNGDKEACNTDKLDVTFAHGTARIAVIQFQNFAKQMTDSRSLLYYLINYREARDGIVTMFDGRDGCNSQNDVWMTIEEAPINPSQRDIDYQEVVITVKPATRYALYVKTFTILAGSKDALSDIIYFETAPDTPGIPKEIEGSATGHDSVLVSWSPPSKPNGVVEKYQVTITKTLETDDPQSLDICVSIDSRNAITQSLTRTEPTHSSMIPTSSTNGFISGDSSGVGPIICPKSALETDPDIQAEVVTFQDLIIDIVYLKQPACSASSNTSRGLKRRSIEYNLDSHDNIILRQAVSQTPAPDLPAIPEEKSRSIATTISSKNQSFVNSIINFDRSLTKTRVNVTATNNKPDGRMVYTITGLEHFTLYTIEVVACHGDFVGTNTKPSKTYSKCSLEAITLVRTLPIEEYDKVISNTIRFHPANGSFSENRVTWDEPTSPNGLILAYRVRYRPKENRDRWIESCINSTAYRQDQGFVLSNIGPGNYLLSVQTVSMYSGQRFWSEPELEIYIPDPDRRYLKAILIATATGVLLISAAIIGFIYHKKKALDRLAYASVNPDYIEYVPDEWEVDSQNVLKGPVLGKGSFGEVYKGQLFTEKGPINCAIKTVQPTATTKQRMDFLREASIMKQFDTFHVVKLIGVVSTKSPVYVIMEYMEKGDLKTFLRDLREVYQKNGKALVDGIYLMAAQIADGMAYLASKKFVHRDLAARNCMVGENQVVKIGDFGLTRDIYANDYYRRDTQGRLPVRWMAPESLSDNMYTSASDVWSYGIVVWEMVTFSAHPYQGLSNEEVIKYVMRGETMDRPENCPDDLFYIMKRCWSKLGAKRPTFREIVEHFLPETEDKLYPNCFYRKQTEDDSIAPPVTEENNSGAESYPLLSWPSNRANGLTNGVNN